MGSGASFKNSGQAQILAYADTLYVAKRFRPTSKARSTGCSATSSTGRPTTSGRPASTATATSARSASRTARSSLQESGFVPRKGSTEEGDGYVMGVASNYAEMASELHIVDAQRMEEGAVAVVELPFRLRCCPRSGRESAETFSSPHQQSAIID